MGSNYQKVLGDKEMDAENKNASISSIENRKKCPDCLRK